ncbi:DUF1858 domain-containing protein [Streptococcus chenjunshii]|uniref:DUF1858 domain-containing protein n=1 Tax=Streptococcus chenjunshii TaxID=2173853 RepID=A0A372KNX2_9STRE|nr:DUF1858 domain-containing protein [Streptococcus chenjunshii]AXQ78743.1 DUF1858 domain-containing protein [Streptococcus chenjunshii]RFU51664.1 DUF1858 domain-containing protein [Streptococcus chenjunshii]RFU53985.1 DUF1858 domain-containing protein [Streptococcus chenjunshii]
MNNTIDLRKPVAETIQEHPEVKDILIDLGFKPLANPLMLKTLGKATSLKNGSKLTKIPLDQIKKTLEFNGYDVIGED